MNKTNTLFLAVLLFAFSACISTQLVLGSSKGDNTPARADLQSLAGADL